MDVREKLVELICDGTQKTEICTTDTHMDCETCRGDCGYCTILADHLIANGVTVQEWISVDERLPENDVMVIGYTPCDGFMFVGYYHEEKKYDWKVWRIITAMRSTKVITKKVTHWMPLPLAPEVKND